MVVRRESCPTSCKVTGYVGSIEALRCRGQIKVSFEHIILDCSHNSCCNTRGWAKIQTI